MRIIRKDFWGVKINLLPCEYYFNDGQNRASPDDEASDVTEEEFVHLVLLSLVRVLSGHHFPEAFFFEISCPLNPRRV